MDYDIRALRENELREMIKLTSTAFESTEESFQRIYELDPFYDFNLARVADKDGKLIAYLRSAPRVVALGKARVRMGGIAEVCTLHRYRRRGIATSLLKDMIELLAKRGFPVSMLYGNPTFYGRLGWANCSIVSRLRIHRKGLPEYEGHEKVREFRYDDLEDLMVLYQSKYGEIPCSMFRSKVHWEKRILKRGNFLVYDDGSIKGYMGYRIKEQEDGSKRFLVEEIACHNMQVIHGMIGKLSRMKNIESLVYSSRPGDDIQLALSLPGSVIENSWNGMFRVNDVSSTLTALKEDYRGFNDSLVLRVTDNIIQENNREFLIEGDDCDIEVSSPGNSSHEWLRLDVSRLSQLVPGTVSIWELAVREEVQYSSRSSLELANQIFSKRRPFQPAFDHF